MKHNNRSLAFVASYFIVLLLILSSSQGIPGAHAEPLSNQEESTEEANGPGQDNSGSSESSHQGRIRVSSSVSSSGVVDTTWRSSPPHDARKVFLSSIPKLIWQTVRTHDAPEAAIRSMTTWSETNPTWDRMVLDDLEIDAFVERFYNETELQLFRDMRLGVMRADLFRYMALYQFGGVYVDADTESLMPIEQWAPAECDLVVACEYDEGQELGWESTGDDFCQWAFAARPRHPVLELLIEMIFKDVSSGIDYSQTHFVHETTGPAMFTRAIKMFYGIHDDDYTSCESFVTSERAKGMRKDGVCWMTQTEMKGSLQNLFSSVNPDFKGASWKSWVREKESVLRELGVGSDDVPDLTCDNADDDLQELIEFMNDAGYSVFTGAMGRILGINTQEQTLLPLEFDPEGVFYEDPSNPFVSGFQLGGQDALVVRTCNPFPVAYWGATASVVSFTLRDFLDGNLKPAAEVGDSLNQFRIKSEAGDGELPWDSKSNFVLTADNDTYTDIINGLISAGLDAGASNLLGIPLGIDRRVNAGTNSLSGNETASLFRLDFRFRALSPSSSGFTQYFNQSFPFTYFYKAGEPEPRTRTPIRVGESPPRLRRGGQQNERFLKRTLKKLLWLVTKKAVRDGYCLVDFTRLRSNQANRFRKCFKKRFHDFRPGTCFFGSQDFLKGVGRVRTPSTPGEGKHLVVGAIHTLTNLAEYATIGFDTENRDTSCLDETSMNCISEVHGGEINNIGKTFVLEVKDECTSDDTPTCIEFPENNGYVDYVEYSVLEEATMTGPIYGDVLPAVVLNFERPTGSWKKKKKCFHKGWKVLRYLVNAY